MSDANEESRNPLANEDENRDPASGEPEVWKGRYDDNGEVARGGASGTALVPEEDLRNPFATPENTDDAGGE